MNLLFSINGRVTRKAYWGLLGVIIIGTFITASINDGAMLIFYLLIFWPSIAIQMKRWHDRNKSGSWILINVIPYIGTIWALTELGCLEGTKGPNKYGDDPFGRKGENIKESNDLKYKDELVENNNESVIPLETKQKNSVKEEDYETFIKD